MRKPLFIRAQWGLGDSIFSRPFVRAATAEHEVFLETPWPELFEDIDLKFVRLERKLRTQMKNVWRQDEGRWASPPADALPVTIGYVGEDLRQRSIVKTIEQKYAAIGVTVADPVWDLPDLGPPPVSSSHPIAMIRPVTLRKEWKNAARNPRPEYVSWVASQLMQTHHVVLVADLEVDLEWLEDQTLPPHHEAFLGGELDVRSLLSLVRHADLVVGGVGWIVPASIALGTRAFVIHGGHGGHNHPVKITDPRMNLSKLGFATPRKFCQCMNMNHQCDKFIPDLVKQWSRFRESQGLASSRSSLSVA